MLYVGIMLVIDLVTIITVIRVSVAGYYWILIFSLLNAIRCIIIACTLLYIIIVTFVNPYDGEAGVLELFTYMAIILFFIIIAIEMGECSIHVMNIVYTKKRKGFFDK